MYVLPLIFILFGIVFLSNCAALTLIILTIIWVSFGSVGSVILHYLIYGKITWKDFLITLTLGSVCGLVYFLGYVQDYYKYKLKLRKI